MSKYGVFSGPYFPVFRLNTEIYFVNLRIQSKYGKIRTRKKLRILTLFAQCIRRSPDKVVDCQLGYSELNFFQHVQITQGFKTYIISSSNRDVFRISPNIEHGAFCENSQRFKPLTIFAKSFILDPRLSFEFTFVQV